MIHIEITNFESIRHIKFDIDGFTTIVGRNFIGKSAVLRAINAALTNASGTSFITWGETYSEVKIKNEKIDLLWHKEDGNNFYVINGQKYTKVGKSDPPDEIFQVGLGPTTIGKDKLNLLYVEQFYPLFLVDKKDSKGIDLLTAAYGLDKIYKAIDLCNKDQRSNKDLLRVRKKDLDVLSEEIKKYEGVEDILKRKEEIVRNKKALDAKQQKIARLGKLYERLDILSKQVRVLQGISSVEVPNASHLATKKKDLTKLSRYNAAYNKLALAISSLKPVEEIEIPKNNKKLKELRDSLSGLGSFSSRYSKLYKEVTRLKGVENIKLPVSPDSSYEKIDVLENVRSKLINVRDEYQTLEKSLEHTKEEEHKLLKDKEQFKGMCPLCGGSLNDISKEPI